MAERLSNPTVYEIYPRSFRDTTGSGEGDLAGIARNLGHVRDLGVDAIWLAPFYRSPMKDGGYDISDHRAVDPRFGTLDDFDEIVSRAGEMGLSVIVDLVFNHTSDEHPWFRAALDGDETAAQRYVWRDPKADGTPPNNWMSFFGSSAWTWNHRRRQYYFHQFLDSQPALDLRNDEVKADHERTVRFWCERGVAGFRLDVVTAYLFDPELRDNPPASPEVRERIEGPDFSPYAYQDHLHDLLPGDGAEYAATVRGWAGPDKWLVGECNTGNKSLEIMRDFTREGRLDALYTTDIVTCARSPSAYRRVFDALDGEWRLPWWFSSHDQARSASAHGEGDPQTAKFLAAVLCAMPGPLLLFQGEELGLPQPDLALHEIEDPFDRRFWPDGPGRSGARVPLPWTEERPAFGFSGGRPWLPMRWRKGLSVEAQTGAPESVLSFYRKALALRRDCRFADAFRLEIGDEDDVLTARIDTPSGRFTARYCFRGEAPLPEGEPLLSLAVSGGRLGERGAAITRN